MILLQTAFFAIFVTLSAFCFKEDTAILTFATAVLQMFVFALSKKRTPLSFSASFAPSLILIWAIRQNSVILYAITLIVVLSVISSVRRSNLDPKPKTRIWTGLLLMAEVLVLTGITAFA